MYHDSKCVECKDIPGFLNPENTADPCLEICGDGLHFGHYECDDSNNIDGDGCDSVCLVELGFACIGGSNTTAHTCRDILRPECVLTDIGFNGTMQVTCNEMIILKSINKKW